MKKTKIVCTIGPASESKEVLTSLIKAGMNVMRLNFSHGDHAEHLQKVQTLREINKELGTNVAFLLDTKGPEIRTGSFGTDQNTKMSFTKGDKITTSQLYNMDSKGLFTKELDIALLDEEVDFTVHSFKDLPTELDEDLEIVAVPIRESPREVLISEKTWKELEPGSKLGTSSLRREAFCNHYDKGFELWKMRAGELLEIPKYHEAVKAYAITLLGNYERECFYYQAPISEWEVAMRTNMGGGLPVIGFYEMKQDIYDIARHSGVE